VKVRCVEDSDISLIQCLSSRPKAVVDLVGNSDTSSAYMRGISIAR
jgi:hypothetical protein